MKIVDSESRLGGPAAPGHDREVVDGAVAFCPHCAEPLGSEFPWPPEPMVCPACDQYIGRNRAAAEPIGATPTPAPRDAGNGRGRPRRSGRAFSFLRGPDTERHPPPRPEGEENGAAEAQFEADAEPELDAAADAEAPQEHDVEEQAEGEPEAAAPPEAWQGLEYEPEIDVDWAPADFEIPRNGKSSDFRDVAARVAVARLAASGRRGSLALRRLGTGGATLPRASVALPRPSGAPLRRAGERLRGLVGLRGGGIALLIVGGLIIAYGVVTVVWQDPITAIQTARAQDKANLEFDGLVRNFRRGAGVQEKRARTRWINEQAAAMNLNTPEGHAVGKLSIPEIGIRFTVIQGTGEPSLAKGPSHYVETPLPGAKGKWTVGIAGHRTTYSAPFRNIDNLDPGDTIILRMPYAKFRYTVHKTRIVDAGDTTALAADAAITGRETFNQLALTACHPPFSAAQRIIVYARLVKRTPIIKQASARQ